MRPRQLIQFLEICRHGSMSAAAQSLGIAQPALSKQVLQLEHELRTTLFKRHSRGVTLTPAGERLREEAAELIRRLNGIKIRVQEEPSRVAGTVTLAVVGTLAPAIAVEMYPMIERDYPDVTLRIVDYSSKGASRALLRHDADLAIVPNAGHDLAQAKSVALFSEDLYLVSRSTPQRASDQIAFHGLGDMPLVLTEHGTDLRGRIEDAASTQGIALNVKYETQSITAISKMVEAGLVNSIVPITFWQDTLATGRLTARRIVSPTVSRVQSLCWLPRVRLSPAAKVLRSLIPHEIDAMIAAGKLSGNPIR